MDFKQLEAYIFVVEMHSFSKAAEMLNVSQPSISAYINSLEQELGVQLIYRSSKEATPTEAGKIFYQQAKKIVTQKEKLISSMESFKNGISGGLNIVASSVPAQYILPKVIAGFVHEYPNIRFNVTQQSSSDVVNAVASNQYEIGFTGAKIENSRCEYQSIYNDELILIAPNRGDYRAISQPLDSDSLHKLPFIHREKGSGTSISYKSALEHIGIKVGELQSVASFTDTQSIINAVSAGLGVSIVSSLAATDAIKYGYIIKLATATPLVSRDIYIVYKKNQELSPIANLFKDYLGLFGGKQTIAHQ